jgi:hypothetical protein
MQKQTRKPTLPHWEISDEFWSRAEPLLPERTREK